MSSPSLDTSPVEIFPLEIESATTFTKVVTTIQLVYGIPSFLLLIAFIFFLGCSKNYQNSFYRLVQLDLLTVSLTDKLSEMGGIDQLQTCRKGRELQVCN